LPDLYEQVYLVDGVVRNLYYKSRDVNFLCRSAEQLLQQNVPGLWTIDEGRSHQNPDGPGDKGQIVWRMFDKDYSYETALAALGLSPNWEGYYFFQVVLTQNKPTEEAPPKAKQQPPAAGLEDAIWKQLERPPGYHINSIQYGNVVEARDNKRGIPYGTALYAVRVDFHYRDCAHDQNHVHADYYFYKDEFNEWQSIGMSQLN
jgi:hypothetical protein